MMAGGFLFIVFFLYSEITQSQIRKREWIKEENELTIKRTFFNEKNVFFSIQKHCNCYNYHYKICFNKIF